MIPISKYSSKHSGKSAKNINWNTAEKSILDESGSQPSRNDVLHELSKNKYFSDEDIENITNIKIEEGFAKILNKSELIFLEIGAYSNEALNQLNEIKDYLINERGVKKPGDLSELVSFDLNNPKDISEKFNSINAAQIRWHENAQSISIDEAGDRYLTHEIHHEFGDGWNIVYVPAIGEGPLYNNEENRSNDRTVEGNKMGICLGYGSGLYQTNSSGEIYSVRDPSNNPHVSIRITNSGSGNTLIEAKGKYNHPPSVEGAMHAKKWFEKLSKILTGGFDYLENSDYKAFPPTTKEEVLAILDMKETRPAALQGVKEEVYIGHLEPFLAGWVSSWYKKGIDRLDDVVKHMSDIKHPVLLHSGLNKKHKELLSDVFEYWSRRYLEADDPTIFYKIKDPFVKNWEAKGGWIGPGYQRAGYADWSVEGEGERYGDGFDPDHIFSIANHGGFGAYKKEKWMQQVIDKLSSSISESTDDEIIFDTSNLDSVPRTVRNDPRSNSAYNMKMFSISAEVAWERVEDLPFSLGLHKLNDNTRDKLRSVINSSLTSDEAQGEVTAENEFPHGGSSEVYFEKDLYKYYPDLINKALNGLNYLIFNGHIRGKVRAAGGEKELLKAEAPLIKHYAERYSDDFISDKELYTRYPDLHSIAAMNLVKAYSAEDLLIDQDIIRDPNHNISDEVISFAERKIIIDPPMRVTSRWVEISYFIQNKLYKKHADLEEEAWLMYIGETHSNYDVDWDDRIKKFFDLNKHKEFEDVTRYILEVMGTRDPEFIFRKNLDHDFAEIAQQSIEYMIKQYPWLFFDLNNKYPRTPSPIKSRLSLEKRYPGYIHSAAQSLFKMVPEWFNSYNLYEKYPEATEGLIEKMIDESPEVFFIEERYRATPDHFYAETALSNMSEKKYGTSYIVEKTMDWVLQEEYAEQGTIETRGPITNDSIGGLAKSRLTLLAKYTFYPLLVRLYKSRLDLDIEKILKGPDADLDKPSKEDAAYLEDLKEEEKYNFGELFDKYLNEDDAAVANEPAEATSQPEEDDRFIKLEKENYSYDTKSKIKQLRGWLNNNGFKKECQAINNLFFVK